MLLPHPQPHTRSHLKPYLVHSSTPSPPSLSQRCLPLQPYTHNHPPPLYHSHRGGIASAPLRSLSLRNMKREQLRAKAMTNAKAPTVVAVAETAPQEQLSPSVTTVSCASQHSTGQEQMSRACSSFGPAIAPARPTKREDLRGSKREVSISIRTSIEDLGGPVAMQRTSQAIGTMTGVSLGPIIATLQQPSELSAETSESLNESHRDLSETSARERHI